MIHVVKLCDARHARAEHKTLCRSGFQPLLRIRALRRTKASCLALTHDKNGSRRTIVWDEENRIQSLFDNGHEKTYKYDALQGWSNAAGDRTSGAADQGQRIIKRGPQGETVYVNQYFTMRNREIGTKHVFAGATRAVSKLMKQDKPGANPQGKTPFEKDLYFFHPDHLGSSNYITDTQGKLFEHLEYFPFGETWVEESTNTQRTPYLFTSKELDEETGLYYYGARYYDPRTSVWQSADPILGKYLDGKGGFGGVYNPFNGALYSYSHQNPVLLKDPDGRDTLIPIDYRWSTKKDFGHNPKNPYLIIVYGIFDLTVVGPNKEAYPGSSGKLIGAVELTWESRMAGTRGSIMGDTSRFAEVHDIDAENAESSGTWLGKKHPFAITDVGNIGTGQDVLTQTRDGKNLKRSAIRLHPGGPEWSLGCGTSCRADFAIVPGKTKAERRANRREKFQSHMRGNVPSFTDSQERTFILVPDKNVGNRIPKATPAD